jgi:ammonia channel protein AmtB
VAAQSAIQCAAAVGTAAYTAVASYACLMATKAIVGGDLRVPEGAEQGEGLDMWCHGEACYTLSEGEIGGGQPAPELANNVTPPAPAPAPVA